MYQFLPRLRRYPPLATRGRQLLQIMSLLAVINVAIAEPKPAPWAENFNDNVIKNMVNIVTQTISEKNINSVGKSINKNVFQQEGIAKIETKDSSLKINTQDAESMILAAYFRKNYIKSARCKEPESDKIRIQCANEYIDARKKALKQ